MLARKKVLGNYNVGKTVGQGAFSKVKLGVHKETGQKVAIKIIDKKLMAQKAAKAKKAEDERQKRREAEERTRLKREGIVPTAPVASTTTSTETSATATSSATAADAPSFVASLQLEVQLMMRLDHPNIINLYSIMETEDECFVVMEYAAGGELIEYIAARNYLSEKEARKFFRQIISAMDHCHMASVVHRDLKLENLLLNDKQDILISDFGLGRTYNPEVQEFLKTFCGTPNYAAVELISGIPYNGIKSDIWAMGVALYVMMTGKTPFTGATISQLYSKIKAVDYKCPDYFSSDLKVLLSKMLKKDPVKRADMDMLRADPWVNFEEVERPLRLVPKVTGIATPAQITQFISSITKTEDYTLYTIRQHTRDGASMEGAGEERNKSVQARRKSLSVQPMTNPANVSGLGKQKVGGRRFSNVGTVIGLGEDNVLPFSTPPMPPLPGANDSGLSHLSSSSSGRILRDPRRMSMQDTKVPPLPPKATDPSPSQLPGAVNVDSPDMPKQNRRASINIDFFQRGRKQTPTKLDETPSASRNTTPDSHQSNNLSVLSHNQRRRSSFRPADALVEEDDRDLAVMKRMAMVSPESPHPPPLSQNSNNNRTSGNGFSLGDTSHGVSLTEYSISESSCNISPIGATFSPTSTVTTSPAADKIALSDNEIEKWHEFNRPPKDIRTARYSFNPKTTSTLSPNYIFQDVHRVLVSMQKLVEGSLQFKRDPRYYLIQCHMASDGEEVEFDVEVCKVWLLTMHGVRIKKQGGSAIKFKDAYSMIVDMLNI